MKCLWRHQALFAFTILALTGFCVAQDQAAASSSFSKEQLEQMVAPIALYPDPLVSQVLMAATYPLEVVEADRWLDKQGGKTGSALETAMKDQTWDPSVKSIVMVPEVLKRMSENLDWTRDLGDAFLGQQAEIMDAVQRMRGMANEAGNLKTSEQQTVTVQNDNIITIESTSPETVYVPEYSTVVYGSGYSYPAPYYGYMYQPGWGMLGFGAGLAVGGALWGNCNWGWGNGSCDVNVNRYNNFGNNTNNNFNRATNNNWNHNPQHRGGVNYKDGNVAKKYGGGAGNRAPSDKARGKDVPGNKPGGGGANQRPGGAGDRPGGAGGAGGGAQRPSGAGDRPGAGAGGGGNAQRPSGGGGGAAQRPAQTPSQRPSSSGGAYQGASKPQADRAASNRGSSSRSGSSGGGSRGGGGGGGRGGGGGGRGGRR